MWVAPSAVLPLAGNA